MRNQLTIKHVQALRLTDWDHEECVNPRVSVWSMVITNSSDTLQRIIRDEDDTLIQANSAVTRSRRKQWKVIRS